MLLKDKNAVITGCNRGIGKEILRLFAENGASVWACVRKQNDEFDEFITRLSEQYHVKIMPVYFDISDEQQIKAGIKTIMSSKMPVDILVNNAGMVPESKLFQMTPISDMKKTFDINFFSQMLITQYISRIMSKMGRGSIVNMASIAGLDGNPAQLEYVSSKAAIIGATKKLAIELGAYGIRVNAVAPGLTDTSMAGEMSKELMESTVNKTIMKRLGRPEEIASVVLFLASDLSSFMTGQTIRADGGM